MAPELLRGDPPTLQSDVYAMGVMLYQIIAADLTKPLTAGWEQDIDDELLREDIAAAAAGNPRHRMASAMELSRRLRSLEARRAGLAAMRARQQRLSALASRLERARARRPWLVAALISFAAGLTASLWFYRAAVASRDEALKQAAVAQGVSEFISQDVLGATSRYDFISPKDVTVIDALNRGVAQLDARSGTMPALIEASNRYVIAGAYSQMAQDEAAAAQVRKAIKLFDSTLGAADIRTLRARYFLAASLIFAGKFPDADAVLQELATGGAPIDAWPELRLLDHVTRGGLAYYREDYARAATFYEQALAEDEQLHATDMEGRATRRQMLASSYVHLSRFAEADRLLEASLTELSRAAKLRSAAMAETQEAYGVSLYYQRRLAEAETLLNSAYSVLAEKLGPDASCSSEALEYLGLIYLATNRIDDSVRVLRAAYGDIVKRAGEANIFSLSARGHLGMAEFAAGQRERGLDTLRQVAAALRSVLGPAAPKTEYFRYQFFRDSRVANPAGGLAAALNAPFDARLLALESPDEDWTSKLRDIDGPMRQKDSLALAAK
jgi:non-specific serine/threonine protein kinase